MSCSVTTGYSADVVERRRYGRRATAAHRDRDPGSARRRRCEAWPLPTPVLPTELFLEPRERRQTLRQCSPRLPIGTLLFLEHSAPAESVTIGTIAVDAPASEFALSIIDGQQRVTSLVAALVSAHQTTDPRFRIFFDVDSARFRTPGSKPPSRAWVPVSYLFDTALLLRWMRENDGWLVEEQLERADQAARALRDYGVPMYIMRGHGDQAHEIFARINSSGVALTPEELELAKQPQPPNLVAPWSLARLSDISVEAGFGKVSADMSAQLIRAFRRIDIYDSDLRDLIASGHIDRRIRAMRPALQETIRFLQGSAGIAHIRLVPHPQILPVLLRFVGLHGAPERRSTTLLRRWLWRGATVWKGIDEPDRDAVRAMLDALGSGTAVDDAQRLLERVTPPDVPPLLIDLAGTDIDRPTGRVNVIRLLSANPRDFESGEPVDVVRIMNRRAPLQTIVAPGAAHVGSTLANMVALERMDHQSVTSTLLSVPPNIAESHLIDGVSRDLLAAGSVDEFLHRRGDAVLRTIAEHVALMAEWGARDGDSISDRLRSAVKP